MKKQFIIDGLIGCGGTVTENELLEKHTTFKIGGPCIALTVVENIEQLKKVIFFCKENSIPFFMLGKGSNVLVSDSGFEGVVIKAGGSLLDMNYDNDAELISAGAGCTLSQLAAFACDRGFSGFEFASGIPGTIGGGIRMNAGAYGGEIADVLVSCTYLDADGALVTLDKESIKLSYRHSIFCENSESIIVSATFRGTGKTSPEEIRSKITELNIKRKDKQPLEYPSAGSTFKRPEGSFAAKLIEDAGLKGYRVGNAAVSEKHSGFVVNLGGASCSDVLNVMKYVRKTVREKFEVLLEPEIVILGNTDVEI